MQFNIGIHYASAKQANYCCVQWDSINISFQFFVSFVKRERETACLFLSKQP